MPLVDLSEHCVTPDLLIVHDPSEFDGFENFSSGATCEDLLASFLFRERPDVEQFREQHTQFVRILRRHVQTIYLSDILGQVDLPSYEKYFRNNPNHMFTHDAFLTIPWLPKGYILSNMTKMLRRDEPHVLAKVAENLGLYEILKVPHHLYLEGGDVIPFCYNDKKVLLIGYGPRTSRETLFFLRDTLIRNGMVDEIIGFNLSPWRINLDGCFFPVSDELVVCHRDSIEGGIRLQKDNTKEIHPLDYIQEHGFSLIGATKEESYDCQACNFVCLGEKRIVAYNMTERINNILRFHGLDVIGIYGDQMVKGNGGPHCMTRPIYLD